MTKVALITGTSTGLGLYISVLLARQGFKTYATMRDTTKDQALKDLATQHGVDLHILPLDVQNQKSIDDCVEEIIKRDGKIDLLVNNAGAGFVRSTEQATDAEIDWVYDVNLRGVIRCTRAVLPHMRQARSGHIVNISSVGGLVGQPFNEFYCSAKFAVEGYTEALASYVTPNFGIHFTLVEPGGIRTEFAKSVMAHIMTSGGVFEDEYKPILERYIGGAESRRSTLGESAYQTAEEAAEATVKGILQDTPPLRMRTSNWAEEFTSLKTKADPDGSQINKYVIDTFNMKP